MIIGISGKINAGKDLTGRVVQYLIDTGGRIGNDDEIPSFNNWDSSFSDWQIKKFAYAVKQVCSIITGIPVEDFEKQEVKDKMLGEEWTRYGYADGFMRNMDGTPIMNNKQCSKERYEQELKTNWQTAYKHKYTVRELLQLVGTNAIRNVIHEDAWVNALMSQYKPIDRRTMQDPDDSNINYPNWLITDVRFPNEANKIKEFNGIIIRVNRNPEIWVPIKGFEDEALVSNLGRIKTLSRNVSNGTGTRTIPGKILSCNTQDNRYPVIMLSDRKTHLVHLLVANAFIPNDDKTKNQVNHKDGVKSNCKVTNLEWCTASYNIQHGYDNNLQYAPKGEQHYNTKITDVIKKEIWYKRNIDTVSLRELSIEYNTHISNICKITKNNKFSNHIQSTVVTTPIISKEHSSETALDDYDFDYVIDNNGTIENLITSIKSVLICENIL